MNKNSWTSENIMKKYMKWRLLTLSELTPIVFNTKLTHLDSESSRLNNA